MSIDSEAMELSEIIYNAICSDQTIMAALKGGVHDTCVPVPPHLEDNTLCPYIIVMENPYTNDQGTKDNVWESDQDRVGVSVQICADDPATVRTLRRKVRHAIAEYVLNNETGYIYLVSSTNDGIAWDWTKPCYYDTLHYQCDMDVQTPSES
jgi:hypothetical protein